MGTRYLQCVDLAVHALWYMAYESSDGPIMIRDIAARQGISESYLAKVFQNLAKTDIVTSVRGKNGGYRLGRLAQEISLGDIVRALDNDPREYDFNCNNRDCTLGTEDCFLPAIFEEAHQRMLSALDAVTLDDLATQLRYRDTELKWIGRH